MAEQISRAACGGPPTVEHKDTPEGTAARGEPTPEQSKDVRRKEWQRDTTMY